MPLSVPMTVNLLTQSVKKVYSGCEIGDAFAHRHRFTGTPKKMLTNLNGEGCSIEVTKSNNKILAIMNLRII